MAGVESAGAAPSSVGGVAEEGITVRWWRFRCISPPGVFSQSLRSATLNSKTSRKRTMTDVTVSEKGETSQMAPTCG